MAIAVKITSPQGAEEIVPLAQGAISLEAVAGASYRLVDTESPELSFEAIIRRMGDDLVIDVLGTDADVRLVDYFFVCELDYRGCSIELDSIGGPQGEVLTPGNTSTTQLSDGSVLLWATPPASAGLNTADQAQAQEQAPVAEVSEPLELSDEAGLPWGTIGLAGGGILALAALAGGGGSDNSEGGGDTAVGSDRAGRGTLATRSISLAEVESDATAPVDSAGNSTTGSGIEIAPGPISPGGQTNDDSPTLTGTIDAALIAGQRVAVYRDGQEIGEAQVDGLQWQFTDSDVPAGQRTYGARIADGDGNQSPLTDDFVVTVDGTAPDAPVLAAVTGDDLVSTEEAAAGVAVTGTAEAGSIVTAQWGQSTQSGQADGDGRFVLQFSPENLPRAGIQSLAVSASDSFGNVSESTVVDVRVSSGTGIAITGVVDNVGENTGQFNSGSTLDDSFPTLIGVLDRPLLTGQSVQVFRNGVFIDTAEVDGLSWEFTNGRLQDGSYSHVVRVINADGTVSAVSEVPFVFDIDVVAPARPTIDAVDTRNNQVTDETAADGVQVSGEGEAGSTIVVTWGDVSRSTEVGADGEWQLTYEVVPVENGRSVIRAVSEDDAGNQSRERAEVVRTDVSEEDDDDADGSSVELSSTDLLESSASAASLNLPNSETGEAGADQSDLDSATAYSNDATLASSGSPLLDDALAARIDSGL